MWIINQKTCVRKKVEGFLVVDSGVLIRQHEHKRKFRPFERGGTMKFFSDR